MLWEHRIGNESHVQLLHRDRVMLEVMPHALAFVSPTEHPVSSATGLYTNEDCLNQPLTGAENLGWPFECDHKYL